MLCILLCLILDGLGGTAHSDPNVIVKGLFVFIPLLPTQKIKFGTQRPGTDDSSGIYFYYV